LDVSEPVPPDEEAFLPPAHRLRTLHTVALSLGRSASASSRERAPLITAVVAGAVETLGALSGVLILPNDPAWNDLAPGSAQEDGYVMLPHKGVPERRHLRVGGTALGALHGSISHVSDTLAAEHQGAYEWLAANGVRSFVAIPVGGGSGQSAERASGSAASGQPTGGQSSGGVLGALVVDFAQPGIPTDEDQALLELFAAHAAIVLERAQRADAERRRTAQAASMAQVLSRVAAAHTVEGVLEELLRGAMTLLGGTAGLARLVNPETLERTLSLEVSLGGALTRAVGPQLPEPGSIAEAIAAGGAACIVEDFVTMPDSYAARDALVRGGLRSAVNVPIDAVGQRLGSLHVNHQSAGHFSAQDLALAEALAALAGDAIERARLATEHAERSRLDAALLVARTVAHEINNALSPITGYAELLTLSRVVRTDQTTVNQARLILEASLDVAEKVQRLQRIIRLEEAESSLGAGKGVLDLDRSTTLGSTG
jgi:GAF domain-containing protein